MNCKRRDQWRIIPLMINLLLLKPPVGSLSAVATFSASHADSAAVTARGSGIFSRAATNNLILLFPSLIILSTNQLITCKRMDMIKLTILRSCISLTKNDGALFCLYVQVLCCILDLPLIGILISTLCCTTISLGIN